MVLRLSNSPGNQIRSDFPAPHKRRVAEHRIQVRLHGPVSRSIRTETTSYSNNWTTRTMPELRATTAPLSDHAPWVW